MSTDKNDIAISIQNVSKTFKLPHEKQTSLKGMFLNSFRRKNYEVQNALKNVSFDVKKGEFFGIVGRNGSGKSTLLKCLAGVYTPTSGKIHINGSLVPFIELGVGFNPELSGRDNVFLNGALLGFSRKQMEAMYDDIVEFAELEQFMDQKLKNYSSGMQVRLAFSIAIRAKGDILVLDEVLAVGDTLFQQKCFDYFSKLKKENRTILLVSHNENALRQYCTSGVLIDNGELLYEGKIDKVVNKYIDLISEREENESEKQAKKRSASGAFKRHGTGKVLVDKIAITDEKDESLKLVTDKQESIVIRATYSAQQDVEEPVYGIVIRDTAGRNIISSNNLWQAMKSKDLTSSEKQDASWTLPNIFNTGEYFISPAVADSMGQEIYDWVDDMVSFKVRKKSGTSGIVNPPHSMKIKGK